ncbi:MAG: UDP-3-O-acyl-N-acetylglucosamine deacetylase [Rhabdochlamydiaceae bacterium]|jgi:UDP-3-O-[3-hydroxymyristoyl] N-acetylglucosamine deacetylase
MDVNHQKTLKKEVVFSGRGVFEGQDAVVRLIPAPPDTGIVFKRVDLEGHPLIPAQLDFVSPSTRCTKLEQGEAGILTVEHLMAALRGADIDNLYVEVSGPEIPILDGSSLLFSQMIQSAGVIEQDKKKTVYKLLQPLSWSQGDTHIIALPSEEYRISYTLHYPQSPYLRSQYYSYVVSSKNFLKEIAPSRTFVLYEEIEFLIQKGILKEGASLENGVVIKGDQVLNPGGVRFPDEMVRHKILDMIGDLSLMGTSFVAHIIAIKSGHAANHLFGKELKNILMRSAL